MVQLLKNPKQRDLFLSMAKAFGQEIHGFTAEQAKVVHVQSKHIKKSAPNPKLFVAPPPSKEYCFRRYSPFLPTPRKTGIVFKDHAPGGPGYDAGKLPLHPLHENGKGKLLAINPVVSDDSFHDEATILAPLVPLHLSMLVGQEMEHVSESLSPLCSPAPLRVFCPCKLLSESQLKAHQGFSEHCLDDMGSGKNDDTSYLVENGDSESLGEFNSLVDHSFHSLHSDSSIVKQIEQLGMDPPPSPSHYLFPIWLD
ncbi:hypothetical protein BVRB_4g092300 [Beta vulgaris subsp. vulgaris]|nr:hypothetical protein BVRB_4g092300 [Beta vulgaris subsp. vulgaris]